MQSRQHRCAHIRAHIRHARTPPARTHTTHAHAQAFTGNTATSSANKTTVDTHDTVWVNRRTQAHTPPACCVDHACTTRTTATTVASHNTPTPSSSHIAYTRHVIEPYQTCRCAAALSAVYNASCGVWGAQLQATTINSANGADHIVCIVLPYLYCLHIFITHPPPFRLQLRRAWPHSRGV